ncbi:DUF4554 domain-containing protein isoform X4 [Silurus meridionalis]|uniref:DUF4554 domain-containing protein isoform X4 n=1 Tax=Silurus meridionalis TaxID=175797 RepID=UPI001EE9AF91|nr:DUF4554 domain-containing protein isoform X4 [Silurus meridionalis]
MRRRVRREGRYIIQGEKLGAPGRNRGKKLPKQSRTEALITVLSVQVCSIDLSDTPRPFHRWAKGCSLAACARVNLRGFADVFNFHHFLCPVCYAVLRKYPSMDEAPLISRYPADPVRCELHSWTTHIPSSLGLT